MVEVKSLCAGYGNEEILHNISFSLPEKAVTAIIGPNGCGKSTLLKSIIGLNKRISGEILIDGIDASRLSPAELAKKAAYLPQNRTAPDMTVLKMVLHGRFAHLSYPRRYRKEDYTAAYEALCKMGIEHLSEKSMTELSGGTQQKAYIAMALAQNSPTVLMDEPTAYLDISHRIQTMKLCRELADSGKAVAVVLHDIDLALEGADNIIVLQNGQIKAEACPEKVFESKIIDKVFDIKMQRIDGENGWQYYCGRDFSK